MERGGDERELLLQPRFKHRAQAEAAPSAADESGDLHIVSIPEARWTAVLRATLALLVAPARGKGLPPTCQQLALELAAQASGSSVAQLPGADAAQTVSGTARGWHAPSHASSAGDGPEQAGAADKVGAVSAGAPSGDTTAAVSEDSEAGAAAPKEPGSHAAAPADMAADDAKQPPPKKDVPAPSRVSRRLEAQR